MRDLIAQIKGVADIAEVISELKVGNFPTLKSGIKARGHHGTHDNGGLDSCVVNGLSNTWMCWVCGAGGTVIDWVIHAKYEGKQSHFRDAVNWLAAFCDIEQDDTPLDVPRYQTYGVLTTLAHRWHQELMADEVKLKYVMDKWALTEETIRELLIGFCGTGVSSETEFTTTELINAGVINTKGDQPLFNRIVFPYFRGGQVVYMSGRVPYDERMDNIPKYMTLHNTTYVQSTLYNYDNAYDNKTDTGLLFVEGLGDAAQLFQLGLRAVATGGTQAFAPSMYHDAKELLRRSDGYKFIVFDSEMSGAGMRGARALATSLIGFGYDPIIVDLPRRDLPHMDVCEYMNVYTPDSFAALMLESIGQDFDTARTLGNILIEECPVIAETKQLTTIMEVLAPMAEMTCQRYLDALAKKTKVKASILRTELKKAQKALAKVDSEISEDLAMLPFFGQDFKYNHDADIWKAHTVALIPHTETVTLGTNTVRRIVNRVVHMVVDLAGDGSYCISSTNLFSRGLKDEPDEVLCRIPAVAVLENEHNYWSTARSNPYSYTNFVEQKCPKLDDKQLYGDIVSLFNDFVYFDDPYDAHIATAFIMMTYIYMAMHAIPYLQFKGEMNRGKSTATDLIGVLSFNTVASSTLSAASMFRVAHATRPTFIIEEAERLYNPFPGSSDAELLALCNGSYTRQMASNAMRCSKDTWQPEAFMTYGPKVFVSTKDLVPTLRSRSIMLPMVPPEDLNVTADLRKLTADLAYLGPRFQDIRDRLRVWGLTHMRKVRSIYDDLCQQKSSIDGRDAQLWYPLMAIAASVDPSYIKYFQDSIDVKSQRSKLINTMDYGNALLVAIYDMYKENTDLLGIYKAERKGVIAICLTIAVTNMKTRLMSQHMFADKYTDVSPQSLLKRLQACNAIPKKAARFRAKVGGVLRDVIPFEFATLERYLKGHKLLGEVVTDASESDKPVEPAS